MVLVKRKQSPPKQRSVLLGLDDIGPICTNNFHRLQPFVRSIDLPHALREIIGSLVFVVSSLLFCCCFLASHLSELLMKNTTRIFLVRIWKVVQINLGYYY
ncbi:hypothetical protein RchiOBHm_Chr5g0079521 [Rosa chinensis]|uniref:Uncharacterized protein n=1 Tax=Rosa chinensis TaxID=74649 RepID=A0A2P6QMI4_ROSCH|nr:hypothetical protein RchiOBHm_Chr5g0079521 [Rosa chinensis]